METHDPDPTSEPDADPWTTFHDQWGGLGEQIKSTYRKVSDDGGPTEDEIKDALGTLAGAWDKVAGTFSEALRDPEVRQRLKDAAGALATAVGRTVGDLGSELADSATRSDRSEEE